MPLDVPQASPDRLSIDTTANINEDITVASEHSVESRNFKSESVFSSLRTSLDGSSSHVNSFNILKQGLNEDERRTAGLSSLGPNSIYDLTVALDIARARLNRAPKAQVTINGGATTVYNLLKPSTKEIPQIHLKPLHSKVSNDEFKELLIEPLKEAYEAFDKSHSSLTADLLSGLSNANNEVYPKAHSETLDDDDVIPAVFEDPDFRLDDQRIFQKVMHNAKLFTDTDQAESALIAKNFEAQEQLSHYLDIVEVKLTDEIARTSDSFFTTLGEILEIKLRSRQCNDQFQVVKSKLDAIELSQANVGIHILDLLDERRSVNHLECSLLQIKEALSRLDGAKSLSQKGENIKCLNQILIAENLINGVDYDDLQDADLIDEYPRFDHSLVRLDHMPALQNKIKTMATLKSSCSRGFMSDFLELLLKDLRSHYTSVPREATIGRIYSSSSKREETHNSKFGKAYLTVDSKVKDDLLLYIKTLAKSDFLLEAFLEYQSKIVSEIKFIIRNALPAETTRGPEKPGSVNGSANGSPYPADKSEQSTTENGTLSAKIKSLDAEAFYSIMEEIYANLSECLRRATVHQKLLLDLSLTLLSPDTARSIDVLSLDITGAINRAIEITQVRLVKVMNVRLEQLGDYSVAEYLKLYLLSSAYLQECESINPGFNTSGPGSSLNEWVRNHVSYYLHRFHSNAVKALASLCDKEVWREYTGDELCIAQRLLDRLSSYADFIETSDGFDGSEWMSLYMNIIDAEACSAVESTSPEEAMKELKVGEQFFMVPHLIVDVVKVTSDYVILSKLFSSKGSTVLQYLITYMKVLNSRISQAILNAGATRTAGLKHITTKHLALCIQTVGFLFCMLEYFNKIFKRQTSSNTNQNGGEEPTFQKVIENYQDHKNELRNKLISIMLDRTKNHSASVQALDLSKPIAAPLQCHPYMEVLVKETLTVAKVLEKYLDNSDCDFIMLKIFENYKRMLVDSFCSLPQFKDLNEKHTLLKDIDYLRVKLDETRGYGNSGQVIWENVNSLPTVEDTRMEEIMRNNIEGERSAASVPSLQTNSNRPSLEQNGSRKTSEEPQKPVEVEVKETETVEEDSAGGREEKNLEEAVPDETVEKESEQPPGEA